LRSLLRGGAFASAESLRDNLRQMKTTVPAAPINVFGILTEFVVLLLGGLLFVIGVSGNYGIASRPTASVVLGVALIFWGVRSARKPTPKTNRTLIYVRSRSVIVLGVAVLAMSIFPREARILLELAGAILIVRGILGAILFLRRA
jgi:hypothetical protein